MILETSRPKPVLDLDRESLDPVELSMGALMREINLRRKPPLLLRLMMNVLEKKRQAKRLGWSRPWNKVGLTVFRTHRHILEADGEFMERWRNAFWEICRTMPWNYREFAEELWADPARMAFTFYHNRSENGVEYEGLTLSLGRKVPEDKTKRDRLDLILEDRRIDGAVDHRPDLARILVNPYREWDAGNIWQLEMEGEALNQGLRELYADALAFYRQHRENPDRQWDHWAIRYIDYFGPRGFIPKGSAFT